MDNRLILAPIQTVYPRTGGEHGSSQRWLVLQSGPVYPRTGGEHMIGRLAEHGCYRFIPAQAGNIFDISIDSARGRGLSPHRRGTYNNQERAHQPVYPRTGGEHPQNQE